ncbi:hypothetical protein EJB05_43170, partial [Eragrostis curvula]
MHREDAIMIGDLKHRECLELEELTAISVDRILLPTLNDLLLQAYTLLRPKPLDYEQCNALVHEVTSIYRQGTEEFKVLTLDSNNTPY